MEQQIVALLSGSARARCLQKEKEKMAIISTL